MTAQQITCLDLNVEHSLSIDCEAESCLHVMSEALLIALLNGGPFLEELRIVKMVQETLDGAGSEHEEAVKSLSLMKDVPLI